MDLIQSYEEEVCRGTLSLVMLAKLTSSQKDGLLVLLRKEMVRVSSGFGTGRAAKSSDFRTLKCHNGVCIGAE